MPLPKHKHCNFCEGKSVFEIRGIKLCSIHAIEALEHGADIVTSPRVLKRIPEILKSPFVFDPVCTGVVNFRPEKSREDMPDEYKEPVSA